MQRFCFSLVLWNFITYYNSIFFCCCCCFEVDYSWLLFLPFLVVVFFLWCEWVFRSFVLLCCCLFCFCFGCCARNSCLLLLGVIFLFFCSLMFCFQVFACKVFFCFCFCSLPFWLFVVCSQRWLSILFEVVRIFVIFLNNSSSEFFVCFERRLRSLLLLFVVCFVFCISFLFVVLIVFCFDFQ